jgi:L-lysine 2,3-aminomutase
MLDSTAITQQSPRTAWSLELAQAIRDPVELCQLLQLDPRLICDTESATKQFPLLVPRSYLSRMQPGNPSDPLLLQVLPQLTESHNLPDFTPDPVGDLAATQTPGLLQKYAGRVLFITTGACAVHCRYCFRRHFPYSDAPKSLADWEPAIDHIAADETLSEVILSGGDPLTIRDATLSALAERLARIPHLRRLRVHTRLPLMIPSRINDELLSWLTGTRLSPVVVIHANHANEIAGDVIPALQRLTGAGIHVLNQAVLLRGINDSVEALQELSERLLDWGVMPYYLHQLDRVSGAAQFEVPVAEGLRLVAELRERLPGYAVPRYVQELPGRASKTGL